AAEATDADLAQVDKAADEYAVEAGCDRAGIGDAAGKGRERQRRAGAECGAADEDAVALIGRDRAAGGIDDAAGEGRDRDAAAGVHEAADPDAIFAGRDVAGVDDAGAAGRTETADSEAGAGGGRAADHDAAVVGRNRAGIADAAREIRDCDRRTGAVRVAADPDAIFIVGDQ